MLWAPISHLQNIDFFAKNLGRKSTLPFSPPFSQASPRQGLWGCERSQGLRLGRGLGSGPEAVKKFICSTRGIPWFPWKRHKTRIDKAIATSSLRLSITQSSRGWHQPLHDLPSNPSRSPCATPPCSSLAANLSFQGQFVCIISQPSSRKPHGSR